MKVVFDTNILLSALVFPGGRADIALRRIIEGKDQLLISKPILDELLGILARKFSRDAEELAHVAVLISESRFASLGSGNRYTAACSPGSTESLIPTALSTAKGVFNVGLPLGDNAR